MQSKRGFTLIELLVVIAIIGILASVVMASLSSSRGRARTAAAQETMHSVQLNLLSCLNESSDIALPSEAIDGGGVDICPADTGKYVALPTGWIYCDDTAGTGCATASTETIGVSFSVTASSTVDMATITCTETGCVTS